jgi:hypothetical protein
VSGLGDIVAFLQATGLVVRETSLPATTFLPGVRIVGGALEYDPRRLVQPADLLHEAGHLALAPPAIRASLDDALEVSGEAQDPAVEVEAIAWSYAAAHALGVAADELFHDGGYRGQSAGLRATFGAGVYPGAAGLARRGLTCLPTADQPAGPDVYPRMRRWLVDTPPAG